MVWVGIATVFVLGVLLLGGCSDDPAETTPTAVTEPSTATSTTTAPAQSSAPTSPTVPQPAVPQPAVPEPAVPEPGLSEPGAPVPAVPEAAIPAGDGEQLYLETCERFVTAIDGLVATGVTSREQTATGLADQLQANPSWSTVPPADQQEILRGLEAAGNGSC